MSFSMRVKEELQKEISTARHCRIAEIAAIILFCGRYNSSCIKVNTENLTVASKYYILLEKTFKISAEVSVRRSGSSPLNCAATPSASAVNTSSAVG